MGRGGMGTVYKAVAADGTSVALKLVHDAAIDPKIKARFLRESSIRIEHENVVRVLDSGFDSNDGYIVLEYLSGQTLSERIDVAAMGDEEIRSLGIQLCNGVEAIHNAGLVHRDLKPANIFEQESGGYKILDFGIAFSDEGSRLTQAGMVIGTPAYLAPEQARGDSDVGPLADLWAVGMILYECRSGSLPFQRATPLASLVAGAVGDVPPLETIVSGVSTELSCCIERALERSLEDRWQDAASMGAALLACDLSASESTDVGASPHESAALEKRVLAVLLARTVSDARAMKDIVEDFGGLFSPLLGGLALGVFGYETWHGDELRQAANAALRLQECAKAIGFCVQFGTLERGGVSGDVIETAHASLEQIEEGIALDAKTAEALYEEYLLVPLNRGFLRLKARANVDARQNAVETIGRSEELARLAEQFASMLSSRESVCTWVCAAPGMGRSHLLRDLGAQLEGHAPMMLRARCASHLADRSFSVLASMIRNYALDAQRERGWPSIDGTVEQQQGVLDELARDAWGKQAPLRTEATRRLGALLEIDAGLPQARAATDLDPMLQQDHLRLSLFDFFEAHLQRGPVVVLVDDAHWIDDASLAVLDSLMDESESPLFGVCTARSDVSRDFHRRHAEVVELPPLDAKSSTVLAQQLAGGRLSQELIDALVLRTGGIPGFIYQSVLALLGRSAEERRDHGIPLPISIEAAAQSQLDHLSSDNKEICKTLAFFGASFTELEALELVQHESWDGVESLLEKGILGVTDGFDGALRYRFASEELMSVAARMVIGPQKKELHLRSAGLLAARRHPEFELIGNHFEQAGSSAEAGDFYTLGVLQASRWGNAEVVHRCAEKAKRHGIAPSQSFAFHMAHASALRFMGQREPNGVALELALEAATMSDEKAQASIELARWLSRGGAWAQALTWFETGLGEARLAQSQDILGFSLAWFAQSLAYRGELERAKELVKEAGTLALSQSYEALLYDTRGQLAAIDGDIEEHIEAFTAARDAYAAQGDLRLAAGAQVNLADAYNRLGIYDSALTALRAGIIQCRRVGNRLMLGYALANLGYALVRVGEREESIQVLREAEALATASDDHRLAAAVALYQARTVRESMPQTAKRYAELARESAKQLSMTGIEALALALLSRLASPGSPALALSLATEASALRDRVTSVEEDEAEIDLALVLALELAGRHQEAAEARARAKERIATMAGAIGDEALRNSFLNHVEAHRELMHST